ncbi:uncharacterized protein BO95DRAFT_227464 [Aspergillus brunneoviolaceus CBS 621.78]|uniref:Uncharacterized protein n=1 Tax=Aspergillus brunneoviolaceus CBS 621.78 TaxID=1450534 RepID=A0ACD1G0L5_9EURO|nr:hypothetical protein BO95DRAFT_227464 [Aspergillus brunneoviolaceus CBS 621.78]RAH42774.1 hypothetical protein BO95DRAFT_227464 [Aspergillus brunneoviolaceus CBS 621.78]
MSRPVPSCPVLSCCSRYAHTWLSCCSRHVHLPVQCSAVQYRTPRCRLSRVGYSVALRQSPREFGFPSMGWHSCVWWRVLWYGDGIDGLISTVLFQ